MFRCRSRAAFVVCVLVVLGACKSSHDRDNRDARKRFLAGEVAPSVGAAGTVPSAGKPDVAPEVVDVDKAMNDPVEMEKLHLFDAATAARLLGSFRYSGKSDFTATRGKRKMRLQETLEWGQGAKGDFYTIVENNHGHGLETWWAGSKFFLRRRYGKAHERPVEGREYLKYREDIFGAWSAIYKTYRGRLKFTKAQESTISGRRAKRFEMSISAEPLTKLAERLPPHPDRIDLGDIKVATAQRHSWRATARPVAATGSIDVDAQTGVIVAVDFRGRLELEDKEEKAEIVLGLIARLKDVGREVPVTAPRDAMIEPVMRKVESRRFDLIDMVRIEDFLIDKWEFPNEKGVNPKAGVSMKEARDGCRAVGKRLCSFKEWQKACHADRPRNHYPYGRIYAPERCNTEGGGIKPAGERKECRGELEVYDLVGNVGEWVESRPKKDGPREWCVAGGTFDDKDKARCMRCVPRRDIEDTAKIGFRCCK